MESSKKIHMISNTSGKKISIYITTYKHDLKCKEHLEMDEKNNKKAFRVKTNICSICLNSKPDHRNDDCYKIMSKSCPICQKNCDYCHNTAKKDQKTCTDAIENVQNVKDVQTSEADVTDGLSLLNEVLTVFQNKKEDINKEKIKTVHLKDVAVCTDNRKDSSRLTISKFIYSIDDRKRSEIGAFTIVNSFQPDFIKKSNHSIDLIKHKSSSIPQMKLEELKYSIKEKSRSKDAIEEVNRMFATVRKTDKYIENSNRPMVRNGPRVLPVVKSKVGQDAMSANENFERNPCRCCHTCMSSGDSFTKLDCCHEVNNSNCDKNVYMLCCHYQNKRKLLPDSLACDHCRSLKKNNYHCEHGSYHDC